MRFPARRWALIALAASLGACGSDPKTPKKPPLPPLETQTLAGVTQGPGARWVIVVQPKAIFGSELATALGRIVPAAGVDRLSEKLGIDVRKVPEALVAGYGGSTFYAARMPEGASPSLPVDAFEKRVLPPNGRNSPRPDIVRVWGTVAAGGRASAAGLWSTNGDMVVGEGGRLGPVLVALALATKKLVPERSLERQEPFKALAAWAKGAPLAIFARCPLDEVLSGATDAKSPIVSQECDGAALSLRPAEKKGFVVIALHIPGRWGKDAQNASDEVRGVIGRVVESDLGRALGLKDAEPAEVTGTPEAVDAKLTVNALVLAEGVRKLTSAELSEVTK